MLFPVLHRTLNNVTHVRFSVWNVNSCLIGSRPA